jgi:glutamyl-tRNA synthetase
MQDPLEYDEKAVKKFLKPDILEPLVLLTEKLEAAENLSEQTQETLFKEVLETTSIKFGKIAQPVRVALTGKTASPGIFEMIETLGKDRVINRLKHAINLILDQQTG